MADEIGRDLFYTEALVLSLKSAISAYLSEGVIPKGNEPMICQSKPSDQVESTSKRGYGQLS